MSHPLLDLVKFNKDHPPRDQGDGAWSPRHVYTLFRKPCERVQLTIEQANDIGHGLWRDEELSKAGIFASDADSLAFAESLNATLGEHLSIRNLEHLVKVFAGELAAREAARQASLRASNSPQLAAA